MKLEKAIKLLEADSGGTVYEVYDCGDRWNMLLAENRADYFYDGSEQDDVTRFLHSNFGGCLNFVFKDNGKIEYKFPDEDILELLKHSKKVELNRSE